MPVHQLFQPPPPLRPEAAVSHHRNENTYSKMDMSTTASSSSSSSSPLGSVGGSTTRRKMRQSQEQIQQLSTTYAAVLSTVWSIIDSGSCSCSSHSQQNSTKRTSPPLPLLRYLLITIGKTFSQSIELYVIDLQELVCRRECNDDGDTGTSMDENNSYHHYDPGRMSRMEITLRRKLISKLLSVEFGKSSASCSSSNSTVCYDQKDSSSNPTKEPRQDVPIHQTLPFRSAPSFRLWLTLGFEQNANSNEESKFIERLVNQHNLILRPNGIPKIRQKTTHTGNHQAIRRRRQQERQQQKFGVVQQNHQTTINETVVVQLQQQQQQQKEQQDLVSCCSTSSRRQEKDLAVNLNDPNITWLSIPTGVKGFRL